MKPNNRGLIGDGHYLILWHRSRCHELPRPRTPCHHPHSQIPAWTKRRPGWNSRMRATARSTRSRQFVTARSMPKNRIVATTYQASIIWSHGKATPRKKTPGSLLRRCYTFANSSAPSTVTIRRSRQRPLRQ